MKIIGASRDEALEYEILLREAELSNTTRRRRRELSFDECMGASCTCQTRQALQNQVARASWLTHAEPIWSRPLATSSRHCGRSSALRRSSWPWASSDGSASFNIINAKPCKHSSSWSDRRGLLHARWQPPQQIDPTTIAIRRGWSTSGGLDGSQGASPVARWSTKLRPSANMLRRSLRLPSRLVLDARACRQTERSPSAVNRTVVPSRRRRRPATPRVCLAHCVRGRRTVTMRAFSSRV